MRPNGKALPLAAAHWASSARRTLPPQPERHTVAAMVSIGRWLRNLAARLHGAAGWLAYRLGSRRLAARCFERVLQLRGADFSAHVHLGRIAFDTGDYARWRRELTHAQRLDADRFARLRHPLEPIEPRLAGTAFARRERLDDDFDDAGERATWQSLRGPGPMAQQARSEPADGGLEALLGGFDAHAEAALDRRPDYDAPAPSDRPRRQRDDCSSDSERARFRRLGPIRAADVHGCDLDRLLRRLVE